MKDHPPPLSIKTLFITHEHCIEGHYLILEYQSIHTYLYTGFIFLKINRFFLNDIKCLPVECYYIFDVIFFAMFTSLQFGVPLHS